MNLIDSVSNRHAPTCGARYIRKNQNWSKKEIGLLGVLILRRNVGPSLQMLGIVVETF